MSRDITTAIKMSDREMLEHVRLRLEDGTVRPGVDVTIDEIIRLRDEGQNPTWELAVEWLEIRYGRRGDTRPQEPAADEPPPHVTDQPGDFETQSRELPTQPELRVAVLEAINSELQTRNQEKDNQIRRLETELDRRAEERREENELQKQNNVLMQQIYDLLEKRQDLSGEVGLLPNSRRARSLPAVVAVEPPQAEVAQGEVVPNAEPIPSPEEGNHVAPTPPRQKKRRAAKRKSSAAKRPAPNQTEPPRTAEKPVSKLFPTFERVARSLFRR